MKKQQKSLWPSAISAAAIISALAFYGIKNHQYQQKVGDPNEDNRLVEQATETLSFDRNLELFTTTYKEKPEDYEKDRQSVYTNMVAGYRTAIQGVLKSEFGQNPRIDTDGGLTFKGDYRDSESEFNGLKAIAETYCTALGLRVGDDAQKAYREALSEITDKDKIYLDKLLKDYIVENEVEKVHDSMLDFYAIE